MVTDPVADLLTRIRNAQRAGHKTVAVSSSKLGLDVLKVLKEEGFIENYEAIQAEASAFGRIDVALKYFKNGEPVIAEAKRRSKPGRRVYCGSTEIPQVHKGLGIAILSTSQGVVSDRKARGLHVGGEVLAFVH